jgi:hypothetical protein
MPSIA